MVHLQDISTLPPADLEKSDVADKTKHLLQELEELQNVMFAEGKHSLLIVFQGMDASGKDGAIREIFSGINPMGCKVKSFKKPTEEEMRHDFLWRVHMHAPEKGMIQIFNRSHYEDVVIQRIHKWVDMDTVRWRYNQINAFENLITGNGTLVLKFFLHISPQEQLERLNERMHDK
ncbi:MAG: polyphosphate kinase, partial [Chitinophagales bacterium]